MKTSVILSIMLTALFSCNNKSDFDYESQAVECKGLNNEFSIYLNGSWTISFFEEDKNTSIPALSNTDVYIFNNINGEIDTLFYGNNTRQYLIIDCGKTIYISGLNVETIKYKVAYTNKDQFIFTTTYQNRLIYGVADRY